MNREQYNSDPRYAKVLEQMDLLGIMDISTIRQSKNGTIVWKLPIKCEHSGILLEVASFASGYVRNQGKSCRSNYQLNKRCESEPDYYKIERNGETLYRKFTTRTCKLIPVEIDRLEYLISYCLKNYYIKHANFVADGEYIPKWRYNNLADAARLDYEQEYKLYAQTQRGNGYKEGYEHKKQYIKDLENKLDTIKRIADYE